MAVADYDFLSTRTDIITRALRLVGALGDDDSPTASQQANATLALNQVVKSWQSKHIFLWTTQEGNLTLVPAQEDYALPTDPPIRWIDKAFYRDASSKDAPELEVVPYNEYLSIIDKAASGKPGVLALNTDPVPTVYLWPVPNEAHTIHYTGIEALPDFDAATSTGGFNAKWGLALTYALATELGPENGLSVSEVKSYKDRADEEFGIAKGGDRERVTRTHVRGAFSRR